MKQWEIWYVKQQHARKELIPPQPNDPSDYDRMFVIIANPRGRNTVICCPVQNPGSIIAMTEVALPKSYASGIIKDCKIVAHDIFTLPTKFFDNKKGQLKTPEQEKVQTALALVLGL